jgi:hypothetical protein
LSALIRQGRQEILRVERIRSELPLDLLKNGQWFSCVMEDFALPSDLPRKPQTVAFHL